MFKTFLLLAALVSLGIAGTLSAPTPARTGGSSAGATTFAQLPPDAQARAKAIYKIDCALCHGDDGNGQTDVAKSMNLTMENWTDGKVLTGKSDEALAAMIRKGKDPMPPEPEDRATDAQVRNLVLYIRKFAKEHPDVIPASAPATPSAASGPSQMHP
ncbi:MAG TPA: cytochrome c [Terracidiphilus sp.]|nr:cytochrome c [Terracidiphilus sp.]